MTMWSEPIPDDPDEERSSYEPTGDPMSDAIGCKGYVTPYVLPECVEKFDTGVSRFPERFDRFYWQPAKILVDIIGDSSPDYEAEQRARKRCEFKTAWAAEHGYVYLAIPASDSENVQRIREMLAEQLNASERQPAPVSETSRAPRRAASKRGQVQRPKATA